MFGSKPGQQERLERSRAVLSDEPLPPAQLATKLGVLRSTVLRDLPELDKQGVKLAEDEQGRLQLFQRLVVAGRPRIGDRPTANEGWADREWGPRMYECRAGRADREWGPRMREYRTIGGPCKGSAVGLPQGRLRMAATASA